LQPEARQDTKTGDLNRTRQDFKDKYYLELQKLTANSTIKQPKLN
jgi:hypothetical protein